jgi:hypothetical protein
MALDFCSAEYLVQKRDLMTWMGLCLGVPMDSYWWTEPNWGGCLEKVIQKVPRLGRDLCSAQYLVQK